MADDSTPGPTRARTARSDKQQLSNISRGRGGAGGSQGSGSRRGAAQAARRNARGKARHQQLEEGDRRVQGQRKAQQAGASTAAGEAQPATLPRPLLGLEHRGLGDADPADNAPAPIYWRRRPLSRGPSQQQRRRATRGGGAGGAHGSSGRRRAARAARGGARGRGRGAGAVKTRARTPHAHAHITRTRAPPTDPPRPTTPGCPMARPPPRLPDGAPCRLCGVGV